METIRQGDVLLVKVENIDLSQAKRMKAGPRGLVLAEGEATGHAHTVSARKAALFLMGTAMYLQVKKPARLEHEEHGPADLEPGTWEVRRQCVYHPSTFGRYVLD